MVADADGDGPGNKAGLKSGDVITAINGNKVEDSNELTMAVTQHAPGETVSLDVLRNGQPMKVNVTLGQRPTSLEENPGKGGDRAKIGARGQRQRASARGISVEPLTPEVANQVQLSPNTMGVVSTKSTRVAVLLTVASDKATSLPESTASRSAASRNSTA